MIKFVFISQLEESFDCGHGSFEGADIGELKHVNERLKNVLWQEHFHNFLGMGWIFY